MGYINELEDYSGIAVSRSGQTTTVESREAELCKYKALARVAKITVGIGIGVAAAAIVDLVVAILRGRGRRP